MIKHAPDGWKVEKISDTVFFQEGPGVRKTQFTESGVKLLNVGNINDNKINLNTTKIYISEEEAYGKYKHFLIEDGDLLIACSGIVVKTFHKKIAFITKKDLPLCLNTSTMRFRTLDKKNLDINFFKFFLMTDTFRHQLQRLITGSAQLNFGPSHIKQMFIAIPPLPQQEKIVKVLDISSALIEKQKELISNYDLFLKSKFIEMFGDPIKNPMGWEVKKLDSFTTLVSSGSTPKGGQSSYLAEGEIRFIRSQNVRMNKMDYNGIYYISEEVYTKMKRSQVKYNDVLLNITGASIGRTAIYKDTTKANVNQHVCIIRLTEELNNEYLSFMISTDSFQNQIISNQSGATREALNYSQIKKFNIPYPLIDLQNKFASIVEKIEQIKIKETQKLEHLETLHKSLIDKAFKGDIK